MSRLKKPKPRPPKKPAPPIKAKTLKALTHLPRTLVESNDFWFNVESDRVTIHRQGVGEESTEDLSIDRTTFDAFVHWYMTGELGRILK